MLELSAIAHADDDDDDDDDDGVVCVSLLEVLQEVQETFHFTHA